MISPAHVLTPVLAACAVLGGCASYHAQPLSERSFLAQSVAALDRTRPGALPIPAESPLTLAEVSRLAVQNSPDLRAARARRGVAQAQVVQAGLLPDPVLSASYNLLLGGPGVANAIGATLSGDITALITLSARRRAAQDAALQVDASLVWGISMQAAGGLFCGTGARPTEQPITGPIGGALLGGLLDRMARLRGNPLPPNTPRRGSHGNPTTSTEGAA